MSRKRTISGPVVPPVLYASLCKEVRRHGNDAYQNRINQALYLRKSGFIKAAEAAEKEAETIKAIAEKMGIRIK